MSARSSAPKRAFPFLLPQKPVPCPPPAPRQTFPNTTVVWLAAVMEAAAEPAVVRRQFVCVGFDSLTVYGPGASFRLFGVRYAVEPTCTFQPLMAGSEPSRWPFVFAS